MDLNLKYQAKTRRNLDLDYIAKGLCVQLCDTAVMRAFYYYACVLLGLLGWLAVLKW